MRHFKTRNWDKDCYHRGKNRRDMQEVEREQTIGIGLLNLQGKSRKGMEDVNRAVVYERS